MAEETRRRTRAKYDGLADALGYAGVDDLLEKHADSTSAELADLLDVSVSGAKWLRRYHAAGFHLDHRPSAPARLSHEELARLEPGDQPVSETHVLCLACGSWFRGLPRHVTARHGLSMDDYRIRFSLAAEVPLVPANVGEANRRAQMERRLRRAQEHGYEDFEDMVARTRDWPAPKVADMMDVVPETVAIWRRRGTSQS